MVRGTRGRGGPEGEVWASLWLGGPGEEEGQKARWERRQGRGRELLSIVRKTLPPQFIFPSFK